MLDLFKNFDKSNIILYIIIGVVGIFLLIGILTFLKNRLEKVFKFIELIGGFCFIGFVWSAVQGTFIDDFICSQKGGVIVFIILLLCIPFILLKIANSKNTNNFVYIIIELIYSIGFYDVIYEILTFGKTSIYIQKNSLILTIVSVLLGLFLGFFDIIVCLTIRKFKKISNERTVNGSFDIEENNDSVDNINDIPKGRIMTQNGKIN